MTSLYSGKAKLEQNKQEMCRYTHTKRSNTDTKAEQRSWSNSYRVETT